MELHARIVSTLTGRSQLRLRTRGYPYEMTSSRELTTPRDRVTWAIEQMKSNGMSLEDLAGAVGCTHATLSQWQSGQTNIENAKVGLVDSFCKITGISVQWLLHGGAVRVDSYTSSDRVAHLTQKLVVMEAENPSAFTVAAKMIDAAATDEATGDRPS